jgi:hypothetical protein
MKPLLLLGAVLMTGASVYGIVDYRQRSSQKAFNQLYQAPAPATGEGIRDLSAIPLPPAPSPELARTEKKEVAKKVKKKRRIERDMFSRAPLEEMPEYVQPEEK